MEDRVDLVEVHHGGGYGSEFDSESEVEKKKSKREDLSGLGKKRLVTKGVPQKDEVTQEYVKEEGRIHRQQYLSLDAASFNFYSRHKQLVNNYMLYYGGNKGSFHRDSSRDKTDYDVLRENHQFLWSEEEDSDETWEKRLAKKYYDKLFKEYCICDLGRYKENKVAMRWRIEQEVIDGKGQFICGSRKCKETEGLRSWEVNFGYMEHGTKKNALVKLRLCGDCSYKLNYHHKKKEVKARKKSTTGKEDDHDDEPSAKRHKSEGHPGSSGEHPSTGETRHEASKAGTKATADDGPSSIWSGPAPVTDEKSREEEFDDYFEDMFL